MLGNALIASDCTPIRRREEEQGEKRRNYGRYKWLLKCGQGQRLLISKSPWMKWRNENMKNPVFT